MIQLRLHHALLNKRGFTLIEAMISILIMSFIMLGTMTWMTNVYQTTTENRVNDEAVKLVQQLMENIRSRRYDSLTNGNNATNITRYIKKTPYNFVVNRTIAERAPNLARTILYNVRWDKNRDGDTLDPEDGNFTAITIVGNKDE